MKKKQQARGSVAGANAEKLSALEKRNRVLEGNCDVFKTEIDHMLVELDTLRALLMAKDKRIVALGGLV